MAAKLLRKENADPIDKQASLAGRLDTKTTTKFDLSLKYTDIFVYF